MAQRINTPVSFSSIAYNTANEDKRWYLKVGEGAEEISLTSSQKAAIITNLFQANGNSGLNTQKFGVTNSSTTVTHGKVIVAVRIPQTKRLLDVVCNRGAASDLDDLFTSKGMKYTVEVSGRSDKKYSEIIDWVKVSDNAEQVADLSSDPTSVYLPKPDASYVKNDADRFHSRMFPYYTSWVRVTFEDIRSVTTGPGASTPDLFLDLLELFVFDEDLKLDEDAPTAEIVFPRAGTPWLPSQTIYFTTRVYEPDTDAVHVRYEIYKETTANTSLNLPGDTLMYTIESNSLNLDGTPNENYSHTWAGLPIQTLSYTSQIFLPGYVEREDTQNPTSVLVVPVAAQSGPGTMVSFANIRFYDNQGNTLKFDAVLDGGVTFTPIATPSQAGLATAQGWLINFGSQVEFNRIDFVNPASGVNPTKVEIYYNTTSIASNEKTLLAGEWNNSSPANNFRGKPFVANIEFCWPAVLTVGTFDPTIEQIFGYKEGTLGVGEEVDNDPDGYNPDRNGIGITETNAGDWSKVHPYAGVMIGPAYASVNSGVSRVHSTELGDSPIPTTAALGGAATVFTSGGLSGIIIEDGNPDTFSKSVAHRMCYFRIAMPDPYLDGERYYAKCLVWDGRTQII